MDSEPNNDRLLEDLNTIPSNGSDPNGLPFGAGLDFLRSNLNLNETYQQNDHMVIGEDICACPSDPGVSESNGQSGLSSDEVCQSCKRKRPENASGRISRDGIFSSVEQAAAAQDNSSMINNSNVSQPEQLSLVPEVGGVGVATDIHQNSGEEGNEATFQRNTRRRIAEAELIRASIPPNSSQSVRPSSWNWALQSNAASASSSPAVHFHEGESSRQAEIRGSLAQNRTNARSLNTIANFVRNISSSSDSRQIPSHPSSPSTSISLAEQYNQRLSEIYYSSMANSAGMQSGYHPPNPSTESMGPPNAFPHPGQPVTDDQIRNRLVEEVHRALGIVHRNGAIHIGSIMILNNSIIYGNPDWDYVDEEEGSDDTHEDMRLDVDNMSYEDLLALEEHIGDVNIGLTEENILAHLRRQRYKSFKLEIPVGEELCCICREEFLDEEELGKLDCGHEFHFNCIKQWLMLKNVCPICKLMALGT